MTSPPRAPVALAAPGPPPRRPPSALGGRLLLGGALAGPLFVTAFLVNGATLAGYDPLRHPVSSLSLGAHGWVQVSAFLVAGLLYVGMGAGLVLGRGRSTDVGPHAVGVIVGLAGVGLVGAGAFLTDPVSGFPPGTPGRLGSPTASGALHDGLSALTFLGIPIAAGIHAAWAARRRRRGWAVLSAVVAIGFLAGFALASSAFAQAPGLVSYGGLFQRLTVSLGLGWLSLLAVRTRRLLHPIG